MKLTKILMNTIAFIGGLILAGSYFLPVEAWWSPMDAHLGYCSGGIFIEGMDVVAAEAAPYAAGLVIALMILLMRWRVVSMLLGLAAAIAWIVCDVLYIHHVWKLQLISGSELWVIQAMLAVPTLLMVTLLSIRRIRTTRGAMCVAALLAISAILQQGYSIASFLIDDRLLLNIGSVTGVAGATAILVALLGLLTLPIAK